MHPETEQLLGTLEVLGSGNFVWENKDSGEFSLWNLMTTEGFVAQTDVEVAFEHWQNIEAWGTPTNQDKYGEYAPTRDERKDDWNEELAKQRKKYYQQLLENIETSLEDLQGYNLAVPRGQHQYFEWDHPYFYVSIIIGKIANESWFCLAPTVPDQVSGYRRDRRNVLDSPVTNEIIATIQPLIAKITPIPIYGYYHGGYNYTYQHRLIGTTATTKTEAISLALEKAGMVYTRKVSVEYNDGYYNSRKLSQFMNECLRDRTIWEINFWDIGYTYELGKTPAGDWIGTRHRREFEYNP